MTCVLTGRGDTETETGRATYNNENRDWMDMFTSQEVPMIAGNYQKPGERQKTDSTSERKLILTTP